MTPGDPTPGFAFPPRVMGGGLVRGQQRTAQRRFAGVQHAPRAPGDRRVSGVYPAQLISIGGAGR